MRSSSGSGSGGDVEGGRGSGFGSTRNVLSRGSSRSRVGALPSFTDDDYADSTVDGGGGNEEDSQSKRSGSTSSPQALLPSPYLPRRASRDDIARQETQYVVWSKVLVIAVLLAAAVACSAATWLVTKRGEENDFKAQFDSYASELISISNVAASTVFSTITSMSTTIMSFSRYTNTTWPFATLPDFEARASELLKVSGALQLSLNPLIEPDNREAWEAWSVQNQGWIQEGVDFTDQGSDRVTRAQPIVPYIFRTSETNATQIVPEDRIPDRFYCVVWQMVPVKFAHMVVNYNLFDFPIYKRTFDGMAKIDRPVLSPPYNLDFIDPSNKDEWPRSLLTSPIYDRITPTMGVGAIKVATLVATLPWHIFFKNVISDKSKTLILVVNSCGDEFTYRIEGPVVTFVGLGDLHDRKYDSFMRTSRFVQTEGEDEIEEICSHSVTLYPSKEFYDTFHTQSPIYNTLVVVLIFAITCLVFLLYDCLVQRRQIKVMTAALRTNAIVSSLFPAKFRDRLMEERDEYIRTGNIRAGSDISPHEWLIDSNGVASDDNLFRSKPIADLFVSTTVLFGDIAGFTAWSSQRQPVQVFILLETIYHCFDMIARKRNVFKVETIGDCYVAVTGLPEARDDHAVAMCRFARECRVRMNQAVHTLERSLGPGTSELAMRFGLHSGPVTAGVLRGEKSRFQLFGDTMNTAARIESTGARDRIHLSESTAKLVIAAGKEDWVRRREEKVIAKGKGELQTYWLRLRSTHRGRKFSLAASVQSNRVSLESSEAESTMDSSRPTNVDQRRQRLLEWNVDTLHAALREIVASRDTFRLFPSRISRIERAVSAERNVIDEMAEVMDIPYNDIEYKQDPDDVEIDSTVIFQLEAFVSAIASKYHDDNPFHNFEHASHVVSSVSKLLARVASEKDANKNLGISADPLTRFSCVLAALIHDVDHPGVPNSTLTKEGSPLAKKYNNKSVAEQNSVDCAWKILMGPGYDQLRATIYTSQSEMKRFRQVIVNAVMATDIMDKELSAWRKDRWERAFPSGSRDLLVLMSAPMESDEQIRKRKATIVLEHLLQASDVAHTMQHWSIYKKWNQRLFNEMYRAYQNGRSETDPAIDWYKSEIGFFDFYIIPLAKKLKECNVFGVASDEYLNYAVANRSEWEEKGKDIVVQYLEQHKEMPSSRRASMESY